MKGRAKPIGYGHRNHQYRRQEVIIAAWRIGSTLQTSFEGYV
jgi:hypothetical protein